MAKDQLTMNSSPPLRDTSYDFMRAAAILLVIVIHISGVGFYQFSANWLAVNVYDSLCRIAVPLFFMLSGALLLQKTDSLQQLAKRILRIAVPLIAWSAFYVAWARHQGAPSSYLSMLKQPVTFHLWFCYTIIGAYLFLPVMRAVAQNCSQSTKIFVVGCWIVAVGLNENLNQFFHFKLAIDFGFYHSFFGFFLLGDILAGIRKQKLSTCLLYAFGWCTLAAIIALGTRALSLKEGKPTEFFYYYLSPLVIAASAFAFLFLREIGRRLPQSQPVTSVVKLLSQSSFGVFLLHPFVMEQLSIRWNIHYATGNSWLWIPLSSVICLVISSAIVLVIQAIPYLRVFCPR